MQNWSLSDTRGDCWLWNGICGSISQNQTPSIWQSTNCIMNRKRWDVPPGEMYSLRMKCASERPTTNASFGRSTCLHTIETARQYRGRRWQADVETCRAFSHTWEFIVMICSTPRCLFLSERLRESRLLEWSSLKTPGLNHVYALTFWAWKTP